MRVPFLDLKAGNAELREELDDAYRRVMDSGWFILGPELEAFETEFAAYCGVRHCVGVGNGLDALRLILEAERIGPGDEVIVPAQTFVATWLAVSAVGATPVPVDVNPECGCIDPALVEAAVTSRTRALLPVHLFGRPADMNDLAALASKHHLLLIEDAAQAHGAGFRGRRTGSLANAAAFSFYPAKNLGALGDGGAITTDDDSLAYRVRLLRNYGSLRKYEHVARGWNSRLDELQAAVLRAKLRLLDSWNERRRAAAVEYSGRLTGLSGISLPAEDTEDVSSSWHLFVVRSTQRDALARWLSGFGIETVIHYPSTPGETGAFSTLRPKSPALPTALAYARTALSLPLGPHLQPAQLRLTVQAIADFLSNAGGGNSLDSTQ